jgi:NADH:ubiquinone oxidoreductase subunit H
LLFILDIVLLLAGILISVAFLTLIERKIISYTQNRKGPNKVSIYGLFQPFSDALKLFSKSFILMKFIKFYFYLIAPLFGLAIIIII